MKMNEQRWQQVETLYHAALEREPGARDAFLAQACADDEELRREVEELLRYNGAAESFIEGNAPAFEARRLKPEELSSAHDLGYALEVLGASSGGRPEASGAGPSRLFGQARLAWAIA